MPYFVLDFEGYKGKDGEMVVKEWSLVDISNNRLRSWTMAPPYTWFTLPSEVRATNSWIFHNLHGIPWCGGQAPYRRLQHFMDMAVPQDAVVYVKGPEKALFVARQLGGRVIIELESAGCPLPEEIDSPRPSCGNHSSNHCSKVKATKFALWCRLNLLAYQ